MSLKVKILSEGTFSHIVAQLCTDAQGDLLLHFLMFSHDEAQSDLKTVKFNDTIKKALIIN